MYFTCHCIALCTYFQAKEDDLVKAAALEVKTSLQRARKELKPHPDHMFTDVYDKLTPRLEQQREEMWRLVKKYKKNYPLDLYEK